MKITRGRALLGTTSLVATLALLASVVPGGASSHREAPLIREDPVADNTDVYAFVSPDAPSTVTLVANYIPLEEPAGGPNFHDFGDDVLYEINVDNNGDAVDDITYEFRFTNVDPEPRHVPLQHGPDHLADRPGLQHPADLHRVRGSQRQLVARCSATTCSTPPANIGPRSTPNYDEPSPLSAVQHRSAAARRSSPASVTTRSSSTSARPSTCSACARSTGPT